MNETATIAIDHPDAPERAARVVAAGGVIAFATDTVYGLGVDLWQPTAIARLFALKGRPDEKALPVLMATAEEWTRVAADASPAAQALMAAFWPGALTIVLPRRAGVPDAVGPQTTTVGLRVPAHDALRRVLARTGPLATSSANRSGLPPALDAAMLGEQLGAGPALLLDGGRLSTSTPSTVVDLSGPEPAILRQGAISAMAIAGVVGAGRPAPRSTH